MRKLLIALVVLALAACSHPDEGQATDWTTLSLQGKTLDLDDGSKIETYRFSGEGVVGVDLGTQGGAITGPVFFWHIKDGLLVIPEEPDAKVFEELSKPRIQGDLFYATRKNGATAKYRLSESGS